MAPSRSFPRVRHVPFESAISSANTAAATRDLEARTNYLLSLIETIVGREALVHASQTMDAEALVGQAVYWNATAQRYEQAQVGVTVSTSATTLAESAECLGLVLTKSASTVGSVLIDGLAWFSSAQLENMIDGTVSPGRHYLSTTTPGKLTKTRPAAAVPVAHVMPCSPCDGGAWVIVNPQFLDFPESHVHYHFELTARPAGTHVAPTFGADHEITDADSSLPGWLPADDAIFDGLAPEGAKFGYNLSAHPALAGVWPPLPVAAALVEMVRPQDDGAFPVAGRVSAEFVVIDVNGIWWMTDCYDRVPWPTTWDTAAESESSESLLSESLSSDSATCPTDPFGLTLWFVKMTFMTSDAVVTSLTPDTDEPLACVDPSGNPATTGPLKLRLRPELAIDADEAYGGQALKSIPGPGFKFARGYVTEGLIAASSRISLTSSRHRRLTPGNSATPLVHQGIVYVDVVDDSAARELAPQIARLGDALDRQYRGITYIGLPEGRNSGVRLRFDVPVTGLPDSPQMAIRAVLFGMAVGPWCELTLSYYRVIRPTENTPTALSSGDTAVDFDVVTPSDDSDGAGTDLPALSAIEVVSEAFTVAAGDTVFVDIRRANAAEPTYGSELGVIRTAGVITAGE